MTFFSLLAGCALHERRQARYIYVLFCLCSDPDSQKCSLAFHGGTETQFLGDTAKEDSAPLPLAGRSGACQKPRIEAQNSTQN